MMEQTSLGHRYVWQHKEGLLLGTESLPNDGARGEVVSWTRLEKVPDF